MKVDIGDQLEVAIPIRKLFSDRFAGGVSYCLRDQRYLRDNAQFDDRFTIQFEPTASEVKALALEAFPGYVRAFDAYRGSIILDEDLALDDWDEIAEKCRETGGDVDGRDGVYRIQPVNYFDQELCRRAFRLTADEIVKRLSGHVEAVKQFHNGVLLIVSASQLFREQIEMIDAEIRSLLSSPFSR